MGRRTKHAKRARPRAWYPRGTADSIRTGLLVGLVMATLFAATALLIFVIAGPDKFSNEISMRDVIAAYYVAGIGGGAIVGAISPLGRSLPGRIAVAMVAALIAFLCIGVAVEGPFWRWGASQWKLTVFLACLFGVALGIATRKHRV